MKHAQEANHQVSINTATSALWCYACDDEVFFNAYALPACHDTPVRDTCDITGMLPMKTTRTVTAFWFPEISRPNDVPRLEKAPIRSRGFSKGGDTEVHMTSAAGNAGRTDEV